MINEAVRCAICTHPMYYHNQQFYCCNRNQRYCILCRGKNCKQCNRSIQKVYQNPKCKICYSRSQPSYIFQPKCQIYYCPKCLITRLPPLFTSPLTSSAPQLVLPCSHSFPTQKLIQFYKGKYCLLCARKYSSLSDCDLIDGNKCCYECYKYEKKKITDLIIVCMGCQREVKKQAQLGVKGDGLVLCYGCAQGGFEEEKRCEVQMEMRNLQLSKKNQQDKKNQQGKKIIEQEKKINEQKFINNFVNNQSKSSSINQPKQNQLKQSSAKPLRPEQYEDFYNKNSIVTQPSQSSGYKINVLPSPSQKNQISSASQPQNPTSAPIKQQQSAYNSISNSILPQSQSQPQSRQQQDAKQKSLSSTQSKSDKETSQSSKPLQKSQSKPKSKEKQKPKSKEKNGQEQDQNAFTSQSSYGMNNKNGNKDSLFKSFQTKQNKMSSVAQFKQVQSVLDVQVANNPLSTKSIPQSQHSFGSQCLGRTVLKQFPSQKQQPSPLPKHSMKRHFSIQTYVQKLKLQLSNKASQTISCKQCQYALEQLDAFLIQDSLKNHNYYCRLCYTMLTNKQVFGFSGAGDLLKKNSLDKSRNNRGLSNQKYKEHVNMQSTPLNKNSLNPSSLLPPYSPYSAYSPQPSPLKKSDIIDSYQTYTTKQPLSSTGYSQPSPPTVSKPLSTTSPVHQKLTANVRVLENKNNLKDCCVLCGKDAVSVIRTSKGTVCFTCYYKNR